MFWVEAFIIQIRFNEVWKKDFGIRPINCIYRIIPFVTQKIPSAAHSTHAHTHTHKSKGEGFCCTVVRGRTEFVLPPVLASCLSLSYLPVLVRTMMALAQHLKDASTAPTATASEGSLVRCECLLSPSKSCLWKVAASASRAI